jgi:hypothetical protein
MICEGFVLILKFVMRIYWGAKGDLFLLDTTTFSLVVFALSRGVYCRVAPLHIEKFFHPTIVLQGQILTMSWIFSNHYKSAVLVYVFRTICSCMSIVYPGLCLLVCSTFKFHEMSSSQCYVYQDVALRAMLSLTHHRRNDDLCHLTIEHFQFWRLVTQTQTFIGFYGRPKFVCLLCWQLCLLFGRPAIDVLNVTSWEVYKSYGRSSYKFYLWWL